VPSCLSDAIVSPTREQEDPFRCRSGKRTWLHPNVKSIFLCDTFEKDPDVEVTSVNYDLGKLLAQGRKYV
jgi:hypothetical protein